MYYRVFSLASFGIWIRYFRYSLYLRVRSDAVVTRARSSNANSVSWLTDLLINCSACVHNELSVAHALYRVVVGSTCRIYWCDKRYLSFRVRIFVNSCALLCLCGLYFLACGIPGTNCLNSVSFYSAEDHAKPMLQQVCYFKKPCWFTDSTRFLLLYTSFSHGNDVYLAV